MYNKKTCHNAETNMSPRKRQKKYKKNQILSVVMAIACTVVTPASDVALSMAFMTQNVYAENIQTTFPDGWNKDDKKDDKKDAPKKGLTAGQRKLPKAMQDAILKKQKK